MKTKSKAACLIFFCNGVKCSKFIFFFLAAFLGYIFIFRIVITFLDLNARVALLPKFDLLFVPSLKHAVDRK